MKAGNYGPLPVIIGAELAIASNGSLDGYLQGSQQQLSTNTTAGTMFFSDGTLWESIAEAQGVGGDQWGVMNELWNFPGQVWLWLYAGMYQIPALNPSNNANLDLDVGLLMILFGFVLPMFAPWIPVINRIPRWIPLYKIIYRRYYANMAGGQQPPTPSSRASQSRRRPRRAGHRRAGDLENSLAGLKDRLSDPFEAPRALGGRRAAGAGRHGGRVLHRRGLDRAPRAQARHLARRSQRPGQPQRGHPRRHPQGPEGPPA